MRVVLDKYEKELEDALENGEFVSAPNLEATKQMFQEAAKISGSYKRPRVLH